MPYISYTLAQKSASVKNPHKNIAITVFFIFLFII